MKTIKCDRCGKDIPYVPSYMNAAKQGLVPPIIIMTVWDPVSFCARPVDLCDRCQIKIRDYIFEYNSDDYNERVMKHD